MLAPCYQPNLHLQSPYPGLMIFNTIQSARSLPTLAHSLVDLSEIDLAECLMITSASELLKCVSDWHSTQHTTDMWSKLRESHDAQALARLCWEGGLDFSESLSSLPCLRHGLPRPHNGTAISMQEDTLHLGLNDRGAVIKDENNLSVKTIVILKMA